MPTPDPPTPTHEEMRLNLAMLLRSCSDDTHERVERYIAAAESTAAELLKAKEQIAELEQEIEQGENPTWKDKPDSVGLWLHVDTRNVSHGYNMKMYRGELSSMVRGHMHCYAEELSSEGGSWFGPVSSPPAGEKAKA